MCTLVYLANSWKNQPFIFSLDTLPCFSYHNLYSLFINTYLIWRIPKICDQTFRNGAVLLVYEPFKHNGSPSQFPVKRAFQIIQCQISQPLLYFLHSRSSDLLRGPPAISGEGTLASHNKDQEHSFYRKNRIRCGKTQNKCLYSVSLGATSKPCGAPSCRVHRDLIYNNGCTMQLVDNGVMCTVSLTFLWIISNVTPNKIYLATFRKQVFSKRSQQEQEIFLFSKIASHQLWCPPSLLFSGYKGLHFQR